MSKSNFSDDFKRDAVAQITERGYPVSEVSQRLGVSPHSLYACGGRGEAYREPLLAGLQTEAMRDTGLAGTVLVTGSTERLHT